MTNKYYTFSTEGLTPDEVKMLAAVEELYFTTTLYEDKPIDLLYEALKKADIELPISEGMIAAWDYWKHSYRPFYKDSYKNPIKLSELVTASTKGTRIEGKGRLIEENPDKHEPFIEAYYLCYRDRFRDSMYVFPTVRLKIVMADMLDILYDTLYFEVVGRCLYVKYNQIIGSRFVAVIEDDMRPNVQVRPVLVNIEVKKLEDDSPDLSYLDQYEDAAKGSEEAGYHQANQQRKSEYGERWWMHGVKAYATIYIPEGRGNYKIQEITSGGLWGIESDSDDAHFKSVAEEEIASLQGYLEQLNVHISGGIKLYESKEEYTKSFTQLSAEALATFN